ncbi:MAG: 4'-phosphopantetheinyl transferase superfamily protein [Acidobacteriia bacterium]|nr:4'-phosphopantetheinyl transferase superfamily protein [Terriglobia bacterium]
MPIKGTTPNPSAQLPELQEGVIQIWTADLDLQSQAPTALQTVLSTDERARATRFYFDRDRNRFTATRALLRLLLGRYLKVPPQSIEFSYGPHGKPFLTEEAHSKVRFNVSHSHEKALLAFAKRFDLGVDVEHQRPERATEELAKRFFSGPEVKALKDLPVDLRTSGFFACWTRKEAFIKATGGGLSISLSSFTVSVDPREPARLVSIQSDSEESSRWLLENLEVGSDYRAAVAVENNSMRVELQKWNWGAISL